MRQLADLGKRATLVIAAAAFVMLAGGASAGDMRKVKIGVEGAYPPFNRLAATANCSRLRHRHRLGAVRAANAECSSCHQDLDGMIPALLAKKYDAIIASMSITEERKKKVDFTEKYYRRRPASSRPRGAPTSTISPEGLKGKVIGVQRATTHENFLRGQVPRRQATCGPYATQDEADARPGRPAGLDLVMANSVGLSSRVFSRPTPDTGLRVRRPPELQRSEKVPRRGGRDRDHARARDGPAPEQFNAAIEEDPSRWHLQEDYQRQILRLRRLWADLVGGRGRPVARSRDRRKMAGVLDFKG